MTIDRREFIKRTGMGLASAFVMPDLTKPLSPKVSEDCMGTLFDATKCVGCRQCEIACKSNHTSDEASAAGSQADQRDMELNAETWSIIELYQDEENKNIYSFVKVQCMHCMDPACVSACPVGALQKTENGPVVYDENICIGCRYCMAACPFEIPKYEWEKVFPRVRKCDFCADRQECGQEPACVEACTMGAITYGKRADLIVEAKNRIQHNPSNYIDHVYGEHEVGGTSNLYISKVPFEKLGLPTLNSASLPSLTWPWMKAVPGVAVTVASLMTFLYWLTGRKTKIAMEEVHDDSGE
jgi:formate dehydrogenase iron-sulfur subunit